MPKSLHLCLLIFFSLLIGCSVEPPPTPTIIVERVEPTATATRPVISPSSTPTPTPLPTETATLTPPPTETPTPTQTPNPPGFVEILPPVSHDLLVLVDGSLKRWNHTTGEIEVLLASSAAGDVPNGPGTINHFSIDAEGKRLVASRWTASNPHTFDLIQLDLISGESRELVRNIPHLATLFQIAPNGCCVAYIGEPSVEPRYIWSPPLEGTIYIADLESDEAPQPVGVCSNVLASGEEKDWGCVGRFVWSSDSRQLLWTDAQGLWAYDLNLAEVRLLQPNSYGVEAADVAVFMPIDWSPTGRYLRLDVGHYEGGSQAVLDMQTGRIFDIPRTFVYDNPAAASVTWMQDDRLLMVRTEGGYLEYVTLVEIWRIPPDQDELLLDWSVNAPTSPYAYLGYATQLENGNIAFAALSYEEEDETAGLYLLDPDQGVPQLIHHFPSQVDYYAEVIWLSSGEGAIIIWSRQEVYDFVYVAPDDPLFYHVRPLFGNSIRGGIGISWVE